MTTNAFISKSFLLIITLAFFLGSCNKEPETIQQKDLVGIWTATQITKTACSDASENTSLTFNDNSKMGGVRGN